MKNHIKLTFKEVREIQKNMLFFFADFCESHNLRYSLGGGTLLGAVRHQGFIPWDDDVDVMMPRPDYEIFLREFAHERYYISNYLKNKDHFYPYAKMYDGYTFTHLGAHSKAVFIDIFPIDSVLDSFDYIKKKNEQHSLYSYFSHYKFLIEKHKTDSFPIRFLYHLRWFKYLFTNNMMIQYVISPFFMASLFNKTLSSIPFGGTSLTGSITGAYGEKEIMTTEAFLEYIFLQFEDRYFSCIQGYDAYLTKHYGDYMQIPPKNQQYPKHKLDYYWKD